MLVEDLDRLRPSDAIEADLVIVGGGPSGLSIAKEFSGTGLRVIVLESARRDGDADHRSLNEVETTPETWNAAQRAARTRFHGANTSDWSHEVQGFGVRLRGVGGSTRAWAGKSAAFDEQDFAERDWVPNSGWPIARSTLNSYIQRAGDYLNLGPHCYDDALWELIGTAPPSPNPDPEKLELFFWQFARSRLDPVDVMRAGPEFLRLNSDNVRIIENATATEILVSEDRVSGVRVQGLAGGSAIVRGAAVVLAASAIENARLLLASRSQSDAGIGNAHGLVGRYLMDHPYARIAMFDQEHADAIIRRFGFFGVPDGRRSIMYMRGLAPTEAVQEAQGLLNCATFVMEQRALDDPWEALKRLLNRTSARQMEDIKAVIVGSGLMVRGVGRKAFQSGFMPRPVREFVVNQLIRYNPNFVVQEFQTGGLPHKLTGVAVDAITEQDPDPENRVTLTDRPDGFGVPVPRVHWTVGERPRRTLIQLAKLVEVEFARAGLPLPKLASWVNDPTEEAVIIDTGHTSGTTRMSIDPRKGVVDANCRVHGVGGLYVAGGSVFPTSGHANPTLMIVALAIRLADQLKKDLRATERPAAALRAKATPQRLRAAARMAGVARDAGASPGVGPADATPVPRR